MIALENLLIISQAYKLETEDKKLAYLDDLISTHIVHLTTFPGFVEKGKSF